LDPIYTFELIHQFRKSFWLTIPRKHGVINHGQSSGAEFKVPSHLTSSILEPHNFSGSVWGSPEAGVVLMSKAKKNFRSRVNTLIFGSSIQKRA
jgi:hypothetical protein